MFEVPVLLVLIVVVALIFDFTNGAHDCANAIATVVSTKVLSPRVAVLMAASLNFIGAFLGTKVATTLGAGIVNTDMVANCQPLVLAALLGAIAWNLITWYFGIPSSSSHALIGGLMGAAVAYAGFSTLNGASIAEKILLPLILSPLAGFGMGFLTMFLIMLLCARANRNKLTRAFTKLQIVSAAFMATSHGLNDAQKTMGVITLALFIFNKIDTIAVPFWVKCVCALAMAMGTALGGCEDHQDDGPQDLQAGARARFRHRDLRGSRHLWGVAFRCARQHHPHHHRLHLRRRLDQAALRRPLGRGREPRHCMDSHHPRLRLHRRHRLLEHEDWGDSVESRRLEGEGGPFWRKALPPPPNLPHPPQRLLTLSNSC